MTYKDCATCVKAGTKPKRGQNKKLVFDHMITMSGPPTIEGHRISAEFMAGRVHAFGIHDQLDNYYVNREELLVCCWWAGVYGPKRLKLIFKEWADNAGEHLWYGCVQIPDPPRESL